MKSSAEEFMNKLLKHPALLDRFEKLLDIIENADGNSTRADDAEELVTVELRALGGEMLHDWAREGALKSEEAILKSGVSVKKKFKKNSTGTPLTVPSV